MKMHRILLLIVLIIPIASCTNNTPVQQADSSNNDTVTTSPERARQKKVIIFFGNSLTAGYGLEPHESFPALIQHRLDSLDAGYEVINAGVSGETSATGSNRVRWVLDRQPVDIFVVELGGNDGLRGVPVEETRKNLEKIIDTVRGRYPQTVILLAGLMMPPSMGTTYAQAFQKIFPEVAKSKNVLLIPFLLENVAGIDTLNLPDGIHPNAQGQQLVRDNVWRVLETVI